MEFSPSPTTSKPITGRIMLAANQQKPLADVFSASHPTVNVDALRMRGFVAVVVAGSVVFGRNEGSLDAARDFPRTAGQPLEDATASSLALWAVKEAAGGAAEIAILVSEVS